MAASAAHAGVLWVHNDSGDEPRLYAVGGDGQTAATVRLRSAEAVDWEDMASTGEHLFVGDIGDNRERRASIQVYRVAEPALKDGAVTAERMDLRYPDGAHDAEALLVHPTTGEVGVITKEEDGAGLYVTPAFTAGRATLTRATAVPVALATGAAVAPDAASVIVRDYTQAYLFDLDGSDLADAFDERPRRVDVPFAIQAEAITFSADGSSLLTTHEGVGATVSAVPLDVEDGSAAEKTPTEERATPVWPYVAAAGVAVAVVIVLRRLIRDVRHVREDRG